MGIEYSNSRWTIKCIIQHHIPMATSQYGALCGENEMNHDCKLFAVISPLEFSSIEMIHQVLSLMGEYDVMDEDGLKEKGKACTLTLIVKYRSIEIIHNQAKSQQQWQNVTDLM